MTITVQGIGKRIGGLQAVDNVSLIACAGEAADVVGPNVFSGWWQ